MTEETPATRPDPELVAEGDTNQLANDDTLMPYPGREEPLDQGYSPPERDMTGRWGETEWEQAHDEPMDRRLAAEEPEVWDPDAPRPDATRAGRIAADPDAEEDLGPGEGGSRTNSVYGSDVGIDGAAASAEEAAVHWTKDPGETTD